MRGENARAVLAENASVGGLGENLAFGGAADEDDGDSPGQTSTAANGFIRHLGNLGKGPRISYWFRIAEKRVKRIVDLGACCLRRTVGKRNLRDF